MRIDLTRARLAVTAIVSALSIPLAAGSADAQIQVKVTASHVLEITGTNNQDRLALKEIGTGRILVTPSSGSTLSLGTGCAAATGGAADCTGITEIYATLRDDADGILVEATLPAEILGGTGDDEIWSGSGNDDLQGLDGSDVIRGGAGNDTMIGGSGDDELYGYAGADDANGGPGDDWIDGGDGADVLNGSSGDDILMGFAGDDWLSGDVNNDRLDGGPGADELFGNGGNDLLIGGSGTDQINGGSGTNTTFNDPPSPLVDAVSYGGIPNQVTLNSPTTLAVINGTLAFNDRSGNGNQIVVSEDSGALVVVDESETAFSVGVGCTLGGNSHTATCTGATDIFLSGGDGNDTLEVLAELPSSLSGGAGYDKLLGGPDEDVLDGGAGDDVLDGRGGADELQGGDGEDRLSGGPGGGSDADLLFGGDGITDSATYFDRTNPVSVTIDAQANDGYAGEGDYVALDVENRASNFVADFPPFTAQEDELEVSDLAWSGSNPLFDITTVQDVQVVGFYERVFGGACFLTVAARNLGDDTWTYKQLNWDDWLDPEEPSDCFADPHGDVRLAIDGDGLLHVQGPMHHSLMRYWRSQGSVLQDPAQVTTLTRYPVVSIAGYEDGVTYPRFHDVSNGRLLLTYRQEEKNGPIRGSLFDPQTQTWSYVPGGAIFESSPAGDGQPYRQDAIWGGWNHHFLRFLGGSADQSKTLFYVRTRDGITFETAAGQPLTLPVSGRNIEARIESNAQGGIRGFFPGHDGAGNPTVGYSLYDFNDGGGTPMCQAELTASGESRVLKARVAVFRNGEWLKKDLKCSEWVWGGLQEENVLQGSELGFIVTAPEERWLNGEHVLVTTVTIKDMATQHFVLDYDTLAIEAVLAANNPPGGTPVVVDWSEQLDICPPLGAFAWFVAPNDPAYYDPPDADHLWIRALQPSTGDTDAGDFYRLVHETISADWNEHDFAAPSTTARVRRMPCEKAE